jgi:hypothetical protein
MDEVEITRVRERVAGGAVADAAQGVSGDQVSKSGGPLRQFLAAVGGALDDRAHPTDLFLVDELLG